MASSVSERIDAHVHLWSRALDPQDWIDPVSMAAIDRDFGAGELGPMLRSTGMDRAALVQSSNSLEESIRLAASNPAYVAGLVGWIDLTGDVLAQLKRVRQNASVPLVGLRHLAHIDPDPNWLLRADVGTGLNTLTSTGLVFDLVVRDWQLGQAATVAARHPDVKFVLDHLGGPLAEDADPVRWEAGLRTLGALPNVSSKLSGLSSGLAPGGWTAEDLRPFVEIAFEAFGPDRLLYGSDWPLAELGGGAPAWKSALDNMLNNLSSDERAAVFGGTATDVYSLG